MSDDIDRLNERVNLVHARIDALLSDAGEIHRLDSRIDMMDRRLTDRVDAAHAIAGRSIKRVAALEDKVAAPLANEHGTGGIYDRLSKLGNTVTFLSQQLDFEALRGPCTVAARLNALEKAERERPTAAPEPPELCDTWEGLKRALLAARTDLEAYKSKHAHSGAELARLHKMTAMSVGVGDGTGKLFVHGDYDSVKAVQAMVFELEELRRAKEPTSQLRRDVDALARAAENALRWLRDYNARRALVESLRPFATEYGFVLPAPEAL